ncbi:replication-relaxation family protein [Streptomyces sp. G-5]|uniref:replication-relaxation family protein n=1 Tax=Streptomyces sp. G-5 TaxID=2977231 RepID=UPI0021CF5860|nr:replication-relaxation family protein [Streptomyces sp. G-5]MCU4749682.1 hypothetical protein [Streptomyces sp. G-5]
MQDKQDAHEHQPVWMPLPSRTPHPTLNLGQQRPDHRPQLVVNIPRLRPSHPTPPDRRGGAQADAVLTAPGDGVPLLFVEVDTCHMDAQRIAAKLDKYMRFFKRTVKNSRNRQVPTWRTRWVVGGNITEWLLLPPLLLAFHRIGTRSPHSTWELVTERSREHWQGHRTEAGYPQLRRQDPAGVHHHRCPARARPHRRRLPPSRPR